MRHFQNSLHLTCLQSTCLFLDMLGITKQRRKNQLKSALTILKLQIEFLNSNVCNDRRSLTFMADVIAMMYPLQTKMCYKLS